MKKQILNIGEALTRAEQQTINGGSIYRCRLRVTQETCDRLCKALSEKKDCKGLLRDCGVAVKCLGDEDISLSL
jgi:hypothetical protein